MTSSSNTITIPPDASSLELLQTAGVENAEHFAELFDTERRKAEALAADKDKHVPTVLFVCGQNAGRSQLAEAIFKQKVHIVPLRFLPGPYPPRR